MSTARAGQALRKYVRVFRLPGIYGPGRSPLDRVLDGRARRIDLPGQVFSRVPVDDIPSGVIAAMRGGPPGVYTLADAFPCRQNRVTAYPCALLNLPLLPLHSLAEARLSPQRGAFARWHRRIAHGPANRTTAC